ncbi:2'-5' RNA ligase [Corynebacterium sp. 320]|uniref:2'-5' RNA ligase family protein n=1 Tax=Corynebacterium TaxID=1716 RepID=UPI00125CA84B|nr:MULTISPECIES: 2'-5' RNA ligase family protein [Corynebacterium]KAB1504008.1 2'-5' RNA ligase [Corynebacterium sp. 320]KAB1552893.1 2'-5' RNA ligase [Corynebacterium sp. 321]KAB1553889.1 2'-5' RNA ligase [Corynebacterium sp. 319]KAB3528144.1 2'-5' RNA ligase [Corynebacterium sp. 250]KAB3540368.1 2'-5' RNA ligase [Corynebacterium sp. 366]
MTSPDNILLHLSEPHEAYVRELFDQLEARGFPRQNQTPHITITFSPAMDPATVKRASQILPPVIPAQFERRGVVVYGTKSKQTVAWLLETTDELEQAARELNVLNPDGRGDRWSPHLTVGLRLPRAVVPDYIRALDELTSPHFKKLDAVRAGLWSPAAQRYTPFAGEC